MQTKTLSDVLLSVALFASSIGNSVACAVLAIRDANENVYQARSNEAVNDQGMSLTTNAFMGNTSPAITQPDEKVLSVVDFRTWALGSFQNVEQVKQALNNKVV